MWFQQLASSFFIRIIIASCCTSRSINYSNYNDVRYTDIENISYFKHELAVYLLEFAVQAVALVEQSVTEIVVLQVALKPKILVISSIYKQFLN